MGAHGVGANVDVGASKVPQLGGLLGLPTRTRKSKSRVDLQGPSTLKGFQECQVLRGSRNERQPQFTGHLNTQYSGVLLLANQNWHPFSTSTENRAPSLLTQMVPVLEHATALAGCPHSAHRYGKLRCSTHDIPWSKSGTSCGAAHTRRLLHPSCPFSWLPTR